MEYQANVKDTNTTAEQLKIRCTESLDAERAWNFA